MGPAGANHHVSALKIDEDSGALSLHGAPIPLPTRPIHMATDIPSEHVLVAFNNPSALRIYRVNADFTPGAEIAQPGAVDPGIFAHQVRATPDNKQVILVTRGHDPDGPKAEEPGALMLWDFKDGVLSNQQKVAPHNGYGFGPRHLDFHPNRPWVYVSLERENRLDMFTLENGRLAERAAFRKNNLSQLGVPGARQAVGTVHVHPNGRFVYVANRASTTANGVFVGGENTHRCLRNRPEDRRAERNPARRHAGHPLPHLPYRSVGRASGGGAHPGHHAQGRRRDAVLPLGVPHRRRRQTRIRPQIRHRRQRRPDDVVDGDGGAIGRRVVGPTRSNTPSRPTA